MKECTGCKLTKEETEFSTRGKKPWRQAQCRQCRNEAQRKWYSKKENKAIQYKRVRKNKKKIREFFQDIKRFPCTDCKGLFPPECMDFDHVKGVKLYNVSSLANLNSMRLLAEELDKCELVCSNCHRIRTKIRRDKAKE